MAEIVYARVSQILQDEFSLLGTDAARTPITGKVQGDFTMLLSKGTAAGQSTTGITITEIGAGKYDVSVAATAFVAATGVYTLRISITVAGLAYVHEAIYAITTTGLPSGTTGAATFTSSTNNGRVTDGSSALPGATVYLRDPSNVLYTSVTTDALGNWGPVAFATAGVYPVYAQLAGYAQGTASITVSGATATLAPVSDIAMDAISVGSGLTLSDLMAYARRMMYDRTGTKADAELKQSVNMALDMVTKAKLWPRYVTSAQLSLRGIYSTGTVTLTIGSANIVLAGGTWPTWAASGKILLGGKIFEVASRTDGTTITIADTWLDADNDGSVSYTLFQDTYDLPDDMYKFGRLVPGQRWPFGGEPVSPEILFEKQMLMPALALQGPWIWTFVNDSIVVYPAPATDVLTGYWYYRRPATLVNPTDEADFDPAHVELLRRAIDYQVAVLYGKYTGGSPEQAMNRFQETMGRSASNDRTAVTAPSPMGGGGMLGGDIPIWMRRT